jgi:hypothetical protein
MAGPDPTRLGGLDWTRRTNGELSSRERRHLLGAIVRGQAAYLAGRVRLATGRVPDRARGLDATVFEPPDSALAKLAEQACEEQTPAVIGHSYRSWAFGSALAALDGATPDREQFYAASLVHDFGLCHPVAGEDFTLRSVARIEQCSAQANTPAPAVDAIRDAITVHITPGITPEHDGELGFYLQSGALLDLAGSRAGELTAGFRGEVLDRYSRSGVTEEITRLIRAEASANPKGRFALLRRCGFTSLIKLAPLKPR